MATNDLAQAIRAGDRGALARGITLVESRRPIDHDATCELLDRLVEHTGGAVRVGITGAPGVGKSSLIEALGVRLCEAGRRVAVLAIDPSSTRTGGSILGDKTRMGELSRHPHAFVRPSPGGGTLGGVADRTQEALLLCEAAGYDVVIVETIGAGQSETAVHDMTDYFLVVLSPAGGDDLQGIKRGVMELADGVLVHKADGDLVMAAQQAAQQCELAVQILHAGSFRPAVMTGSSRTGEGLDELWQTIETELDARRAGGVFDERRRRQAIAWLERTVRNELLHRFLSTPAIAADLDAARERVARGEQVATSAARQVLRALD